MSKTLKDAIEAKLKLQYDILALIADYEKTYGAYLTDVILYKNHTVGCREGVTTSVKIKVEV